MKGYGSKNTLMALLVFHARRRQRRSDVTERRVVGRRDVTVDVVVANFVAG